MKFAHINEAGVVVEIVDEFVTLEMPGEDGQTASRQVPLSERFSPEFIAQLVPYDPENPPPAPPAPPAPIPQSVSRAQAKLALLGAGLLDDVEQAIAGMTGDELRRATIEWNERATFERQSPFLLQMAAALGLDDAALDALFVDAANQ